MSKGFPSHIYQDVPVIAKIDPTAAAASAVLTSDAVDMENASRVIAYVQLGNTDRTVDALLESDELSAFGSPTTISGKTIVQFSATDDNKIATIEAAAEEISGGVEKFVRLKITVGAGGTVTQVAGLLLALPRYLPGAQLAAVSQNVF